MHVTPSDTTRSPARRRHWRGVRSVPAALAALALAMVAVACSDSSGDAPASPTGPELAAKTSCATVPPPTYPGEPVVGQEELIAEHLCATGNLSPANAQSALVKWLAIIREAPNPSRSRVFSLLDFVAKNWLDGLADPDLATFESDLLLLIYGVDTPTDVPVTVEVIPAGGGTFCDADGLSCYTFPPGWSATDRLLISYPIDCGLVSDELTVHPACEHRETVPQGFFLVPVTLVQCFLGDDDFTPVLTKRFEAAFDDPLGTNLLDVELFLDSVGGPTPPACVEPAAGLAAPAQAGAVAGDGATGGKRGGSGLGLQLRITGSQVSAFSDWGFTTLEELTPSIEGTITSNATSSPIAGATVELRCDADTAPRQSVLSAADGSFAFDGDAVTGGFDVGDVCTVRASAVGYVSETSASLTVEIGLNEQDLALDPLQASATTVFGTVRHPPSSCTGPECSSTLVGGAEVLLSCTNGAGGSFSDVTTTGDDGGSSDYGRYAFTQAAPGFGSGWQCTVTATFGAESGSAGPLAIVTGANKVDLQIF